MYIDIYGRYRTIWYYGTFDNDTNYYKYTLFSLTFVVSSSRVVSKMNRIVLFTHILPVLLVLILHERQRALFFLHRVFRRIVIFVVIIGVRSNSFVDKNRPFVPDRNSHFIVQIQLLHVSLTFSWRRFQRDCFHLLTEQSYIHRIDRHVRSHV